MGTHLGEINIFLGLSEFTQKCLPMVEKQNGSVHSIQFNIYDLFEDRKVEFQIQIYNLFHLFYTTGLFLGGPWFLTSQ